MRTGRKFGLWGLLMCRPTWLGLAYVMLWETSLEKVLGWLANFTLRTQLRNRGRLDLPGLPGLGPFGSTYSGPLWTSALVLLTIAFVCIVLPGMIVGRRELVLSR